ncbi:MAG: hypothetical protein RL497_94, partial [Pseudomonadota bacterium]
AFEKVIVIENTENRIILQHLLVSQEGHVTKHWRQDWFYEARERFEFVENQRWEMRAIAAEKSTKAWTQCVYEVSDAPRYCGTAVWNHNYDVSTWTSDRTWRPLPRREYTVRKDYNALNVENRHTVTPMGWTHEQDNTKVLRDGPKTRQTLVREFGFNNYRSIKGFDFSPAELYWSKTSSYWAQVRAKWDTLFTENKGLILLTEVDGTPIVVATFSQADKVKTENAQISQAEINDVFLKWVKPL